MVKRQFTLKNVIKNDQKLVMGWVGIKMPWVENRKFNNRVGGGGLRDDYSGLEICS